MNAARRAFLAKQKANKLNIPPEVMKKFEEETDKLHAFYSTLIAGTSLSKKELWKIIEDESRN